MKTSSYGNSAATWRTRSWLRRRLPPRWLQPRWLAHLCLLGAVAAVAAGAAAQEAPAAPHEAPVRFEQLLKTTTSWDGSAYARYPAGTPEITVLRVSVPPHTELSWHTHPMISAVYLVSGKLSLKSKDSGQSISFQPGDVFADTVDLLHRGYTEDTAVEMIVFFAGTPGMPLKHVP